MDENEGLLCFLVHINIIYHDRMVLERGKYPSGWSSRIPMVVASSVARFTAGQLAVLCFPVKGNWATADPLRRARARVDNNM